MTDSTPTGGRGPRGPYSTGRQSRRVILDAAGHVFAERGFRGGVLRDVADRAGVTAGTVLHHFGSKQRLLLALLEERDLATAIDLQASGGSVVDGIRDLVRRNSADRRVVRLFTTLAAEATDPSHPAYDIFRARYTMVRDSLTAAVATAQQQGVLPHHVPSAGIAAGLIAVMDGLQIQWLLDPDFDMADAFDAHLRAIGALPPSPADHDQG